MSVKACEGSNLTKGTTMDYEEIIARALCYGDDPQIAENRYTLKMLVERVMYCKKTGSDLSQDSSIAVELSKGDDQTWVGPFDATKDRDQLAKELRGISEGSRLAGVIDHWRILDGAVLFGNAKPACEYESGPKPDPNQDNLPL